MSIGEVPTLIQPVEGSLSIGELANTNGMVVAENYDGF